MEEKQLIVTLISALSFVILLILVVVFSSMGKKSQTTKTTTSGGNASSDKKKKSSIEQMLEIAANRNSSKNDLTNAIIKVAKELTFPPKIKGKMPKDAKLYLNFVLLITSHKNSDAKLIAFMDYELKKVNKAYSTEIDIYENEGLRQRINRV